jgi:DivIVA domain-containing protein
MRLQPMDILNREFKKAFRGLDPDDVEEFLDQVYEDYDYFYNESETLKQQIAKMEVRSGNTDDKDELDALLQQAEDEYSQRIRKAEKEADSIIQNAYIDAQKIRDEAKVEVSEFDQDNGAQDAIEIITKANLDADDILKSAKMEADHITQQAQEKADALTRESEAKAREVELMKENIKIADDTIQNANKEAETIIQKAEEESKIIIQRAKDQLAQEKEENAEEMVENLDFRNFKDINPILDQVRSKAYAIIDKAKIDEMEARREILRLKNQKERYLMGYRELLSRQVKSADDKIEA